MFRAERLVGQHAAVVVASSLQPIAYVLSFWLQVIRYSRELDLRWYTLVELHLSLVFTHWDTELLILRHLLKKGAEEVISSEDVAKDKGLKKIAMSGDTSAQTLPDNSFTFEEGKGRIHAVVPEEFARLEP
ncbi:unnamed protein product [Allacma fusca]|uniref:Uncharacterized protein n=1 Tax=Allacma fusca TaxID=39272 RepID=A0A8J2JJX1_9HEXA|nr:unnamed protein product [Allacma fusca]